MIKDKKYFDTVFFPVLFIFIFCSFFLGNEIFMVLSSLMIIIFLFVDTLSTNNNNDN